MSALHALAALFAAYMLVRHVPGARAALRGGPRGRPMAMVSLVNVALAVAILAFAVKGMLGGLISR